MAVLPTASQHGTEGMLNEGRLIKYVWLGDHADGAFLRRCGLRLCVGREVVVSGNGGGRSHLVQMLAAEELTDKLLGGGHQPRLLLRVVEHIDRPAALLQ